MRFPADYHMHTPLCHHAVGSPSEYAAQALALGLDEIGFSEHNPMPRDDFDDWHMFERDVDAYVESVEQARRQHPALKIRIGLEVDFIPGHEPWIRKLASRHPWDYFIGSVHYVSDSWDLDNPKKISEWQLRDTFQVWSIYFDRLTQAAASGLFDIIGHADLCKKFCFYPKQDCSALYRKFLETARDANVAIEINTAGLRKDCKEMYPNRALLELASKFGVPLTFGSDAHAPGEVGHAFGDAIDFARGSGYRHTCRFLGRERSQQAL